MLKQPSSKERETLGGRRKDCTVAALLPARLSSNKGSTECIRRARAGNSFCGQIIAWQLDHCLFVEGLLQRRLSSGRCLQLYVLPEEVMHRQPQKVDSKSPARRLTHLADHPDSHEKAAWETSLQSVAGPRAEAPAFCIWTFFRVLLGTKFIVALCLSKEQEVQDTVQEAIGEAIGETHKRFFLLSPQRVCRKKTVFFRICTTSRFC